MARFTSPQTPGINSVIDNLTANELDIVQDLGAITLAQGDVFYYNGTNTVKLAAGTSGQFLKTLGVGANPAWDTVSGTGDMVLADVQTVSGAKTFLDTKFFLRNVANTFSGSFVNTNTANRIYTLKDASGTIAFVSDITGTNSGTNTGDQTSIVGITGTMAQFDTAVTDGNIVYQSQALGTPLSGSLVNCTGLPLTGLTGDTTTALGIGSINLGHASDTTIARSGAGAITVEGVQVVLAATSPTLATITTTGNIELGHASDTTISRTGAGAIAVEGVVVALNSTSLSHTASTLELGHASDTTIARSGAGAITVEGVQVVLANTSPTLATITTTGNIELGHASDTTLSRSAAGVLAVEGVVIPSISSTSTLTNKRITKRVVTTTDDATAVIDTDITDVYELSAMANATTFTVTGTPTDGQTLVIRLKDNATPRALTWTMSGGVIGVTLPTTTVASKWSVIGFMYFSSTSSWKAVAVANEA